MPQSLMFRGLLHDTTSLYKGYHVETVVLLSRKTPDDIIEIDIDLDEFDITTAESKATYEEIKKYVLDKKLSGVYEHVAEKKKAILFRGFDDKFMVPHSRNTTIKREDVEKISELKILSSSQDAGIYAIMTKKGKQIFVTGHSEYDPDTLKKEYLRDIKAGLNPDIPENYFPDDNPKKEPVCTWRSSANLLYSNWLNYIVYQTTPYDVSKIARKK